MVQSLTDEPPLREEVVGVVLEALPTSRFDLHRLVRLLPQLEAKPEARAEAAEVVVAALPTLGQFELAQLVAALPGLAVEPLLRARAVRGF